MKTADDLDQRLERFYQAVRGEVPAAPPAWVPEPRGRGNRLTPVLAAAAIAVFFIGLVLGFRQLHLAQTAPATTSQGTAAQAPALSLGAVHTNAMWMVRRAAVNQLQVSTDGGSTWETRAVITGVFDGMTLSADGRHGVVWTIDVSPSGCSNGANGTSTCAHLPTDALTVYSTVDGGLHWTARTPTTWPAEYVSFRESEGWATSRSRTSSQAGGLYHTTDAGLTWQLSGTLPPRESMGHTYGAGENILTAAGSGRVWFASQEIAKPGDSGLYLTVDGGRTWQSQPVQAPAAVAGQDAILGYPLIFADGRMALPVRFGHPTDLANPSTSFATTAQYMYTSADGGRTWNDPVVLRAGALQPRGSEYLNFSLDSTHWWFITTNDHPTDTTEPKPESLASTSDGGKTWHVSPAPSIFQMMFSDPNNGWAEAEAHIGSDYINILLRTTDGGAHWSRVTIP